VATDVRNDRLLDSPSWHAFPFAWAGCLLRNAIDGKTCLEIHQQYGLESPVVIDTATRSAGGRQSGELFSVTLDEDEYVCQLV
jgi:hypothetical protein